MQFLNPEIRIEDLPRVEGMEYKGLHSDYLQVSILTRLVQWVFILGILITGLSFGGVLFDLKIFLGSLAGWVVLMAISLVLRWIGFRFKAYALRKKTFTTNLVGCGDRKSVFPFTGFSILR